MHVLTLYAILDLGKIDYDRSGHRNCKVTIKAHINEQGELSMIGNVWNPIESDIYCGGQCYDTLKEFFPYNKKVQRLIEIWKRWHLNHLRAGTQKQEEWLRAHADEYETLKSYPGPFLSHYDWATRELRKAGLNPDNGYMYGSAWLKEELPTQIIAELSYLMKEVK